MSKSTDTILKVKGKTFRCSRCGANVFSKGRENGLWICNGCKTEYVDENFLKGMLDTVKLGELFIQKQKKI